MVDREHPSLSLVRQCALLGVSPSSLYYRPRAASAEDLSLMGEIDRQYLETPFFGVQEDEGLAGAAGYAGEPEAGAAADACHGAAGHLPAAWHQPKGAGAPGLSLPDLLRNIRITRPNQVWAADITYLPMARGFLYLVAVMDWHSRYVLAWRLSNTLEAGFCAEALEEALAKGQPEVFNTDQGSQFTSWEFTQILQDRGVRISMDGNGRYQDNIFVERLWRTVKYEEVYLKAYASVLEAQRGLEDYFRFYNGLRPHQALGYRTPAEVFYGEQEAVAEESNRRRGSPEQGTQSLAGALGLSLNSALILSK